MAQRAELVGRKAERERLTDAIENARRGTGSLGTIRGGAGGRKSGRAGGGAGRPGRPVVWGRPPPAAAPPYAPIVAALRAYLRADPGGFDDCGSLRAHLALI